ncbi:hypothetical protein O181_133608 [Austropuccinia psidii MF-1]|uniref:Uncharacterized protein n=1 Tax=Austropuccinia psidii MF-1 TaxID=1389203 RepID=A0A9Q3L4L7_9BASI|nr:hypothetical protein [Austropuccinia psidii MF-1]
MRPKGAKGGSHLAPKPQSDPPEPKLVTNPLDPKLAKDLLDTNLAINPVGPIFGHGPLFQPWPLETTRGHQTSSAGFSPNLREILSFLNALRTRGYRSGAYMVLYTIMHHFCSEILW